jgi:hypothetical protein
MAGVALDTNAEESLFRQLKSPNDVEAQNRGLRRQIRTTAHQGSPVAHRGVRWRLGCYPAVTPALELVRFEFTTPESAVFVGRSGDPQAPRRSEDRAVTYM